MSRLIARIAKTSIRVLRRIPNEPVYGTKTAKTVSRTTKVKMLIALVMDASISSEQTGRLHRQHHDHRRLNGENGERGKQCSTEIVGNTDEQSANRSTTETSHAADDDNSKSNRKNFEIQTGINSKEGAADHATNGGQGSAQREDKHRDAIGIDAQSHTHLSA